MEDRQRAACGQVWSGGKEAADQGQRGRMVVHLQQGEEGRGMTHQQTQMACLQDDWCRGDVPPAGVKGTFARETAMCCSS